MEVLRCQHGHLAQLWLRSGGLARGADVCLNDCTNKSFGTSACGECTSDLDPGCDTAWDLECRETKIYCSDPVAGYRLRCVEIGNDRTIDVECLCDPDAIISGRRR